MNVLLIDDHVLFRQGAIHLLEGLDESIGFLEADDVSRALEFRGRPIDLVLLDMHLKGSSGPDALAQIRTAFPEPFIVVVSGDETPALVHECIELGAAGFIPKSATSQVLISALRLVLAKGVYIPSHALSQQVREIERESKVEPLHAQKLAKLTPRQDQMMRMAIRGMSNKEIGRVVGLTEHTVKSHLSSVYRIIGARNRTEAVYRAAQLGLHFDESPPRRASVTP
jgi:DNA-binding NarL/FixJ family response regulator